MDKKFYKIEPISLPEFAKYKGGKRRELFAVIEMRTIARCDSSDDALLVADALNNKKRFEQSAEHDRDEIAKRERVQVNIHLREKLRNIAYNVTCDPFGVKARAINWAADLL